MHFRFILLLILLLPLHPHAQGKPAEAGLPDSLSILLRRAGSDSARIAAHLRIASAMEATDFRKALEHATRAVQLSEKSGNHALQFESNFAAGGVAMRKGLFDVAVTHFTRNYELAMQAGDEMESSKAYFNLGSAHLMLGEFAKARDIFKEADPMMQRGYRSKGLPIPDYNEVALRMNLALCHLYLQDFQKCDSMLDLSLPMVEANPALEAQRMSHYHIRAMLYNNIHRPDDALNMLQRARSLALGLNDQPRMVSIRMTEGESLELKGDTIAARRAFAEALSFARAFNGVSLMVSLSDNLYKSYRNTGPADSTVKYFELYTDFHRQSGEAQAKEALIRQDLKRYYDNLLQEWEQEQRAVRLRYIYLAIIILLVAAASIAGVIVYRNRYRRLRLERAQRELEARRTELELLRQQAELGRRDAEHERIRWQLEKQQLIEGLVGGLQALHGTTTDQGPPNTSAGIPTAQRRSKAWEEFEYRFQQVHNGFYDRLNQRYPKLTLNERRLCALLLLDMTTKEISDITGQSVRAVNLGRIRLRRKFGITHTDMELFAFLSQI
jgi:tetratricopeptide (TPR) repeat protein